MRKYVSIVLLLVVSATVGHIATLMIVPGFIMNTAMEKMAARGLKLNQFSLVPRMTPQTQTVVRPSPDLAYSVCLFDFTDSNAPLEIRAEPWHSYGSISFFDDQTNNFATVRAGGEATRNGGVNVMLTAPEQTPPSQAALQKIPHTMLTAPTQKGLILIRRLAPSAADYAAITKMAANDVCRPMDG